MRLKEPFMDLQHLTKTYSNGEITVVWKPGTCTHSTICWKEATGLPAVFNPKEKPWIKIDASNSQRIMEQVSKCLSGALGYFINGEINNEPLT